MSLGETIEFLRVFRKQAKHSDDLYSESEPRALLSSFFFAIFQRREAKGFHEDKVSGRELDVTDFL